MKIFKIIIVAVFLVCSGSSCCYIRGYTEVTPSDGGPPIEVPCCKALVKYSGTSLNVTGVKIPLGNNPIEISGVTWKPEVIQQASETVQILDNNRMHICQLLPALASSAKRDQFHEDLKQCYDDEQRITQLALLIKMNNPEAVKKWTDAYINRATAIKGSEKGKGTLLSMTSGSKPNINKVYTISYFLK